MAVVVPRVSGYRDLHFPFPRTKYSLTFLNFGGGGGGAWVWLAGPTISDLSYRI